MKRVVKLLVLLLSMSLMVACGTSSESTGEFKPGTYTIKKEGYNKSEPIEMEITISEDQQISKIEILNHKETEGIGAEALAQLPETIIEKQSVSDIDAFSGATLSSVALFKGVKEALKEAGLDEADLVKIEDDTAGKANEYNVDVVIVGAGGAGMVAAIEAKKQGANVLVLEKVQLSGGNAVKATGGMNAAKTPYQNVNEFTSADQEAIEKAIATAREKHPEIKDLADTVETQLNDYLANPKGYFDSQELYILDTIIGGKGVNDRELVETLVKHTSKDIEWLKEKGMVLDSVGAFGGASVKRIHRPMEEGKTVSVGAFLMPKMTQELETLGVDILYNTNVNELIVENDQVVGVKAENGTVVNAKAVIIATGGFGADLDRVVEYKPELKGFVTTNAPGATGDGIDMAVAIGAKTVDMDQIQIHPTVEQEAASLITEGVRGDGAILVNQEGKRFTNEVGTRDEVSAAEIAQTGGYTYLIFDQKMADASGPLTGYIDKGFTKQGNTIEALAEQIETDPTTLSETLAKWNESVKNLKDEEFGRTAFTETLETAPYYAIKLSPGIHHTMGGLAINTKAEVLNKNDEPIKGLFAAGEVTGGIHGANRLGGNAVADIVVYGRIAGQQAAEFAK